LKDISNTKIDKYIPKGFIIESSVKGFLNSDSLLDYAIIIKNPDEMDSKFLVVLFQNNDNTFAKSLENNDFITTRYENTLEIRNGILHVETFEPWNGTNSRYIDLLFKNNDWLCLKIASSCGDSNNSWESDFDFTSGAFKIKHTIYDKKDQTHIREISGVIDNTKPISIITDKISNHLSINYKGREYYLADRYNLWSNDELNKLIEE